VVHWDDVEEARREEGFIGATWRPLGWKTDCRRIGVNRIDMAPGEIPTPPHVHHDEEEIHFVLSGSGLSWQDGKTYAIGAGDVLVHRVNEEAHTLRGGDDGLSVLAFGQRGGSWGATLPRSAARWARPGWVEANPGDNPWVREAALGPPDFPEPEAERPETIRRVADADAFFDGALRALTPHGLTERTGLNHVTLAAGATGAPRHAHSTEEELYVVLDGAGTLYLGDDEHPVRAGHLIAFPSGTRTAHGIRGGEEGLTFLAYGERRSDDLVFYPTSGRVLIRGIGVVTQLEPLPYPAEPDLF
jgi:uncharacterized cupin superfamily protein